MTSDGSRRSPARIVLLVATAALIAVGWWLLTAQTKDALVVYCAHDLLYAESVLRDFERQTGVPVVIVGDTEATKSLGLVQRLIREKNAPQCDVFWNNQMLGTVELARQGILEPYRGESWGELPEQFRDDEGLWTGFGGRLRVWISNTQSPVTAKLSFDNMEPERRLENVAMAQPMFGTTLSHYAVLWDQLGADGLKRWHQQAVEAGLRIVPGNATVKDLVASGVCSLGMTDTDDYFQAQDAGAPVSLEPIHTPSGHTICIPNTVAIIKGTTHRQNAERLVDYLTSPEMELRLARSKARQIPLSKAVDPEQIPKDVQPLVEWARDSVDLKGLADARAECLAWLATEFAP